MALDISGLEGLDSASLDKPTEKKSEPVQSKAGRPLEVNLADIDEDENQPRTRINEESLSELAQDIKKNGVHQAIVLREMEAGRYKIIAGHRRFKASHKAGLKTIPAFIDEKKLDEQSLRIKQLSENIHREDLAPFDIANALQRFVDGGLKQKDLVERISKSKVFVSEHLSLLSLPDYIKKANDEGICTALRSLLMLGSLAKEFPEQTEKFVSSADSEISRSSIDDFQKELRPKKTKAKDVDKEEQKSKTWKKPTFKVLHNENDALVLMKKKTSDSSLVWIKKDFDGSEEEVEIESLKFICIQEAD